MNRVPGGRVLEAALERGHAAALVERPPRPDRRHRLGRGQAAPCKNNFTKPGPIVETIYYRVIHMDGYNLPLTEVWEAPAAGGPLL